MEETMRPGVPSVKVIARAHEVNANQVINRRKLHHAGRLQEKGPAAELLPMQISDVPPIEYPAVEQRAGKQTACGTIHIEFGRTHIRVEGSVDPFTQVDQPKVAARGCSRDIQADDRPESQGVHPRKFR